MRLMALGEAWIDAGGVCLLASSALPEALDARVRAALGFETIAIDAPAWSGNDARATLDIARRYNAAAIAVDSYFADTAYLGALETERRTAFIDDVARQPRYPCSLLVNQNLSAADALYAGKTEARLLLGPHYVMLRREFISLRGRIRAIGPRARRLLITFGGVDPKNASAVALSALGMAPDISGELIVGAANPRAEHLAGMAGPLANATLVHDARDMAERIAATDMILSAGGTTIWEAAALGAPMMLVASAPEEEDAARHMTRHGGIYLGLVEDLRPGALAGAINAFAADLAARARSSVVGRGMVDCFGAERVAAALKSLL